MIPTSELIDSLDMAIDVTQVKMQKFLHFYLSKEVAALVKVEDIAEVLQIPGSKILPIPQMPKCVLGIYNWRDEMLWNVALNDLLGLAPVNPNPSSVSSMAIVVALIDGQYLGLVVEQVNDIEWHEQDSIQPPTAQLFPAQLLPFMQGYLSDGTIILDPGAIARSHLIQQFK